MREIPSIRVQLKHTLEKIERTLCDAIMFPAMFAHVLTNQRGERASFVQSDEVPRPFDANETSKEDIAQSIPEHGNVSIPHHIEGVEQEPREPLLGALLEGSSNFVARFSYSKRTHN